MSPIRFDRFGKKAARGFTLLEMMIVSLITSLAVGGMLSLLLLATRSFELFSTQMPGQTAAAREMHRISEQLRNARFSTIQLFDGSNNPVTENASRIDFQSAANPAGQVSRFEFVNGRLNYLPNVADTSLGLSITTLENVAFSFDGQMVNIEAVFRYSKMRGYGQAADERLNGTFASRIFPRNN